MEQQTIPEGYKQTDVGVLPEDWELLTLGEISVSVGSGKTDTKSKGDYPLYGSTGLIGSCKDPEYKGEALLVARVGANAGRLNSVAGQYGVSDNTILIKLKPEVEIEFVKYCLVNRNLNSLVFGSGQPLITGTQLKELLLPFPLKKEQTAIANALSGVDGLITSLEQLIAKKRDIKTGTMQKLLTGKTRLPQFANHPDGTPKGMKSSELGEIPEDWEVTSFGDALKIRHGRDQKAVQVEDGAYPILATGGEIGRTNTPLYTKPSVLIGRKGSINQPRYMDTPFWTVDTQFYSEVDSKFDAKFLFYKACMINWMEYNEASGVPSLNASTIEAVSISCPFSKEEQEAIKEVITAFDSELEMLDRRLRKTRKIKQGMMQELLTGKTRLV
ncbi:restriction endonuclease subunit S [Photobacterium leiognathi]|uniref:restriction endonuclease subunit S n=1 Tax=Photobacterium leiognathi TaxID=553611 RepID=UPI002734D7D0|nr:restriction endonuclease subunit S [Photobacterium leiognathi]